MSRREFGFPPSGLLPNSICVLYYAKDGKAFYSCDQDVCRDCKFRCECVSSNDPDAVRQITRFDTPYVEQARVSAIEKTPSIELASGQRRDAATAVKIKMPPAEDVLKAKQAYEGMRYQVILEIDDEDVKSEESRREVVYNFPPEFVRKGEIVLNQPPVQARFKLAPFSATPP